MIRVDDAKFKQVVGCFPTGVAVVAWRDMESRLTGITISSFTSLSLDPPLILFCLNKNSRRWGSLRQAEYFSVTILDHDQGDICRHFARHAQQTQWDEIDYDTGPLGCPIPNDAVAWMECRRTRYYLGGDHYIILGQVMTLDVEKKSDATRPLLYYRSKIFPENKSAKKKL